MMSLGYKEKISGNISIHKYIQFIKHLYSYSQVQSSEKDSIYNKDT